MPPPVDPPKSSQPVELFFCLYWLPLLFLAVKWMSGRDRNWTPPPAQTLVPPDEAELKSCAAAGCAKAVAPKRVAAYKYKDFGI